MKCTNKRIGQLIAMYEFGALEERDERLLRDHLVECEYCYSQIYSMEPLMQAFRNHRAMAKRARTAEAPARQQHVRSTMSLASFWGGAPALAVCTLIILLAGGGYLAFRYSKSNGAGGGQIATNRSPWADLEVPKAPYVESDLTLRNPSGAFANAMKAYQANNFKQAAEQLETIREIGPGNEPEVNFYLGSSLLLDGRNEEAIPPLERAVESSIGARREASHYYLALAFARVNRPEQAVLELDRVIAMNREYLGAAKALREQILDETR